FLAADFYGADATFRCGLLMLLVDAAC
ncbi:hypothetical protein Tco_0636657, partial [Tanacetum coccineum]